MFMANIFSTISIHNCRVGISLPAGDSSNNVFSDVRITETGTAVEQRDAQLSAGDLMRLLGLPGDTPVQHLVEALRIAEEAKGKPRPEQIQAIQTSSLVEWLGSTADITAVAAVLLSDEARAFISTSIERLFG